MCIVSPPLFLTQGFPWFDVGGYLLILVILISLNFLRITITPIWNQLGPLIKPPDLWVTWEILLKVGSCGGGVPFPTGRTTPSPTKGLIFFYKKWCILLFYWCLFWTPPPGLPPSVPPSKGGVGGRHPPLPWVGVCQPDTHSLGGCSMRSYKLTVTKISHDRKMPSRVCEGGFTRLTSLWHRRWPSASSGDRI